MNNDLISREALRKALKSNCDLCHDKNTSWCEHCCPLNDFEDLIDNTPTVEIATKLQPNCNNLQQGEWVKIGEIGLAYTCNKCGEVNVIPTNFARTVGQICGKAVRNEQQSTFKTERL